MSFILNQIKILEKSAEDMDLLRSLMREPDGSGLSTLGRLVLDTLIKEKISEVQGARILGYSLTLYRMSVKATST